MSLDFELEIEVDTGGEPYSAELFSRNITHNVHPMWNLAGCGDALYESDGKSAGSLVPELRRALVHMRNNPKLYGPLNPPNGWGNYEVALAFLEDVTAYCERYPKAIVRISR